MNYASMRPAQKARDNSASGDGRYIADPASMRPAQKARDNATIASMPKTVARGFNEARAKSTG